MKFSTMMAVFAATLAFAVTGCRYDKAGAGAGDDANTMTDIGGTTDDLTEGSLDDLAAEKRFEDMYARCTDVDFAPVYFGFDSTVVPAEEMGKIDEVAQHLASRTERVVVVEGHCDERGSNEYNVSLGENRAIIIRNYLVQNGVDAGRIQTRSFGEEKPAVEGHDESAWAKNRRGEFGIYDTTQKK